MSVRIKGADGRFYEIEGGQANLCSSVEGVPGHINTDISIGLSAAELTSSASYYKAEADATASYYRAADLDSSASYYKAVRDLESAASYY